MLVNSRTEARFKLILPLQFKVAALASEEEAVAIYALKLMIRALE